MTDETKRRHPQTSTLSGKGARLPVPPVHRVPAHLARRFHQICLGLLSEVTEPESLSPVEYAILGSLDDSPGMDQRTLAERIGIDTVSAHQLVGRLETRGLINQAVDPDDRRARLLTLTARGLRLRQKLRPEIAEAHARIMAPLSARERAMLTDLLGRVVDANEAYARPGNGRRPPRRKQ
jgi:MarR family transcriptional regulator, temperature-dependent positive regulator of motility